MTFKYYRIEDIRVDKKILLKFKGRNGYENSSDETEFLTQGRLIEKNGKYFLKYTESLAEDGGDGVTTTMKIENSRVTVIRYGETNTQMIMETGKKHISLYETPYGSVVVGVITDNISLDIGKNRGKIRIDYDLEVNDAFMSKNCINLSYEEIGGKA